MKEKDKVESFRDKPFSKLFHQPHNLGSKRWRIRNSASYDLPEDAGNTKIVTTVIESLGIHVRRYSMGSPINQDSNHLSAAFLDGGLSAMTGRYFFEEKGAWIEGPKAVLLVALMLGLRVRPSWREKHSLGKLTLDDLHRELLDRSESVLR